MSGLTLQQLVPSPAAALKESAVIALGRQLAIALDYLHQRGILHRDIKPTNVIVGDEGILKVVDFGLATLAEPDPDDDITRVGMAPGTLRYMAPEVISGSPSSPKSDIYALGVTLLFALTGQAPLEGASFGELASAIVRGSLRELVPTNTGPGLTALLSQLLALDPASRPASMADVVRVLEKMSSGPEETEQKLLSQLVAQASTASGTLAIQPPRPILETQDRGDRGSVAGMVTKLAGQIAQLESSLHDVTVAISVRDVQAAQRSVVTDGSPAVEGRVDATFSAIRERLRSMWRVSLIMTLTLFGLFTAMLAVAVIMSLVYREPVWGLVFGGGSVASIVGVVLWKPMDKMLFTTIVTQQLELIQLNYFGSMSGTRQERRDAYREVSRQLDLLMAKLLSSQRGAGKTDRKGSE